MVWGELFGIINKPSIEDMDGFIGCGLWLKLKNYIGDKYKVEPFIDYSKCSMQTGWNIKYKKGSKSLCTIYPMEGFFIVLLVVNARMVDMGVESCIEKSTDYIQKLYNDSRFACGGKWLMIQVENQEVLNDVMNLLDFRL